MLEIKQVTELLAREKSFFLVSHVLPDGDSVGSLLALGEALQQLGKQVGMFIPGVVPHKYRFLKGSRQIADDLVYDGRSTIIALDCSDLDRVGEFKAQIERAPKLVNIDHHISNQYFGTINLVNTLASATGEIVFSLLSEMGVNFTPSMATALYVALATDTGSFKFENTTPDTHRIAAALIERGSNPGTISQRVFDQRPLHYFLLLKEALSTLELYCQQRIAVLTISRDMLDLCGATEEDMDGIVNYSRNIEGVELGLLLYTGNNQVIKVGFRSAQLDVSKLAAKFGGGGHAKAAGCRVPGSYLEVKTRVLQEAEKSLQLSGVSEGDYERPSCGQ
ncbi:MAG TPA: bifunctional oligoribonuclease/PAP phosphatase NrnA [Firmicutes bacterium]|nr:bifunctional oligoribonuclease/PAP phosphatase NrnA [Bacillota bacterium]